MKKTAIAAMMLAAAFATVSCEKEAALTEPVSGLMTINAVAEGVGTPTKAEMAYKYDVLWSASDKIFVTDGTNSDTFTLTSGQGTTAGTFQKDNAGTLSGTVEAFYPASVGSGLVWPATQSNGQVAPMYSKKTLSGGETEDFTFSSLGAVMQIVFNSAQQNVILKSIEIKDGSETMSGAFTVDGNGQAIISATGGAGITLDLGTGVNLGQGANYFNIAIPAGEYKDLTLTFTAADGRTCVMKSSTLPAVERNVVGRITLTGDFSAPAEGVQLWADGPYWARTNIGAANAWDYGLYFDWGNIIGYAPNGTSFSHTFNITNYANTPGAKLEDDFKTASYDAAQASWGGKWRMPTKAEFDALLSNCDMKWYDGVENQYYGKPVAGYKFTGKGDYSGDSIFLPAAGCGSGSTLDNAGFIGRYWSSSYDSSGNAYDLGFNSVYAYSLSSYRYYGFPVRPVSD